MHLSLRSRATATTLRLQNALLCMDCESITSSRCDQCPTCGSRALLSLIRALGGSLLFRHTDICPQDGSTLHFDMEVEVMLKHMEAKHLNAIVEGITRLIRLQLENGGASFHVAVEPILPMPADCQAKAA